MIQLSIAIDAVEKNQVQTEVIEGLIDLLNNWLTDGVNNWEDSLIVDRTSPFSVDKKSTMYTLLLSSMIPRNPIVHFCNWVYLILLSFETWFESTASLPDQKKSLSK